MRTLPLALIALCFGTSAEAATLRTVTTLHAPVVRLSDLFDDAGANANRILGPGPGPGGRIVVEAAQLGAIARQFKVDWRPASTADRAVLDWPGRPLYREAAIAAVKTALLAAGASPDCEIELSDFTAPLVPSESETRPIVADLQYRAEAGQFSGTLSITADAMEPINLRIAGRVDDMMELPVATTRLPAGTVLRPEDVHMARVRTSMVHGEVAHQAAAAVGLQIKRQMIAGQPFLTNELMRPAMVQKGANVLIQLDSPGLSLTAQGRALESGAIGERIRVLNPTTHAVIEAEVTGPDRVRVAPNGTRSTTVAHAGWESVQ
jgi:flagella basal body P-ring formation protein FlgA